MAERIECAYCGRIEWASGVLNLIANGLGTRDEQVSGGMFCDNKTPLLLVDIDKSHPIDFTCYGPDDPKCPGFEQK